MNDGISEIEKLRKENENFKSVMIAAAELIASRWEVFCDEEGYGPINLLNRLERGIPSSYSYKAGDFARLQEEVIRLKQLLKDETTNTNDVI